MNKDPSRMVQNSGSGLSAQPQLLSLGPESPTNSEAYDERLERLQSKLSKLEKGTLPELARGVARLEADCRDRQQAAKDWYQSQCDLIDGEHAAENLRAQQELEAKRQELTELLLHELSEKRRAIELERSSFDLNFDGDVHDVKQPATRKLRRRQPDAVGSVVGIGGGQSATEKLLLSADSSAAAAARKQFGHQLLLYSPNSTTAAPSSIASSSAAAAASASSSSAVAASATATAAAVAVAASDSAASAAAAAAAAAAASASAPSCSGSLYTPVCSINPMLEEAQIYEDLKAIGRCLQRGGRGHQLQQHQHHHQHHHHQQQHYHHQQHQQQQQQQQQAGGAAGVGGSTPQVVDSVLFYRDRCYTRGTPVAVEGRDGSRYAGVVTDVTQQEVYIKRASDGGKVKLALKHLRTGRLALKRKA